MDQPPSFQVLVTVGRKHYMGNSMPANTILTFPTKPEADTAYVRVEEKNKLQQEFIYSAIQLY